MIPYRLEDWTKDAIHRVADSGITENDVFDFKADLQPAEHQRKTVAAFANTRGGFLIFGVTNDRQIVGVANPELPRDFGGKLRAALEPAVDYRVAVPIDLGAGRCLYVVEVSRSMRAPHGVLVNGAWIFLKRTAGGSNDSMTYEEVRLAFQDTEMKRSKLALVSSALELIKAMAERVVGGIPGEIPNLPPLYRWAWVTRYPTTLLDSVLGDAFSLLAGRTEVWKAMAYIRDLVRVSNTLSESLGTLPFSALHGADKQKTDFQKEIRDYAVQLRERCEKTCEAIAGLLQPAV